MSPNRLTIQFLSEDELDRIEETAYRLLSEVGIILDHPEAVEMLQGLGCKRDKGRVHIPGDVIQWALNNIRPHREVFNIDGTPAFTFGDGRVRFHNGGGPPFIVDLTSGKKRGAILKDVADITRLLDALPHVDQITPLFGPQDVPSEMLAIASTDMMVRNTRKPVSSAAIEKPEHVPYIVEMAAACCGGKETFEKHPSMSISVSPISPLRFSYDVAGTTIAIARAGAPLHPLPAPMLGATAPITMAAALAQQHAETLACYVIAAAAKPGALVAYCSRINPMDMRNALASWGSPEVGMSGACSAQLGHRLGMACDTYGFSNSNPAIDAQFAYERFANAFAPALAGVDILSGVGVAESGLVAAHEIAVLDNEMISEIKHIIAGCEVSEDTLAFDVMKEVILDSEVFLSEEHTVRYMRKGALWRPEISVRGSGKVAEENEVVLERAKTRAAELVQTHHPEPLPEYTLKELDNILERASRNLVPA
jgi:trimethylamine---corrinoid protein Co-methyltransferase